MNSKLLFQMRSILYATFLIAIQVCITPAKAQNMLEINIVEELAKLKQEKLEIDANLKKKEAICYKEFAVSDCLKVAKTEAQADLNKVKRREIEIKDFQRKNKAESSLDKSATGKNTEKNSDEVAISEAKNKTEKIAKSDRVVKLTSAIQTDAEILAEKSVNDKLRADAARKRLEESNQKLAASQKKAQSRANKNSQSSANIATYNQKLIKAEAHKADLEKKNLERKKAKSAPLPTPDFIPDSIPAKKVP